MTGNGPPQTKKKNWVSYFSFEFLRNVFFFFFHGINNRGAAISIDWINSFLSKVQFLRALLSSLCSSNLKLNKYRLRKFSFILLTVKLNYHQNDYAQGSFFFFFFGFLLRLINRASLVYGRAQ